MRLTDSNPPDRTREEVVLGDVLTQAELTGWKGHDKHDGLNSKLVWALAGWSRPTRILALQAVMRFPLDIRRVIGVPEVHNPKGLALFIQAHVSRWRLSGCNKDLETASLLAEKLAVLRSAENAYSGRAWGYMYPWQDLGFFAPQGTPNAVVTSFVCEALLDLHSATGSPAYLDLVRCAAKFLIHDLPRLVDEDNRLCFGYMPLPMRMRVMDVSILVGALFARLHALAHDKDMHDMSRRLLEYVVRNQTKDGAWWYTDPPEASPVRIDNYHTGFILDALWRYMQFSRDRSYEQSYYNGLEFYARHLFETDGAPRWMSDQSLPHDIHGCAQGIITFCRHSSVYPGLAEKIAHWTLNNLYDGRGKFWYRCTRWGIDKRFFLRWNNGWMARALSEMLIHRQSIHRPETTLVHDDRPATGTPNA